MTKQTNSKAAKTAKTNNNVKADKASKAAKVQQDDNKPLYKASLKINKRQIAVCGVVLDASTRDSKSPVMTSKALDAYSKALQSDVYAVSTKAGITKDGQNKSCANMVYYRHAWQGLTDKASLHVWACDSLASVSSDIWASVINIYAKGADLTAKDVLAKVQAFVKANALTDSANTALANIAKVKIA